MGTRALGTVAVVMGVVGVVLSVVGIILVWWGVGLLRAPVNALADGATAGLAQANEALGQLDGAISQTQQRVAGFRESAAARVADASERAGDRLATSLEDSFGDAYTRLREQYVTLSERVAALDRLTRTATTLLPNRNVPALPLEQLQQVDQRVNELNETVTGLRTTLRTEGLPVPALLQQVDQRAGLVEQRLGDVAVAVGGLQGRLDQVGETVRSVQSTAHLSLTVVAIVLTLLFVYLAMLHVLLFYQGRVWSNRRPGAPSGAPVAAR